MYNGTDNGVEIGNSAKVPNHNTLYVPEGITAPEVTVTFISELPGSGKPLSRIPLPQAAPELISTVILFILPPTPAMGTHIE
jgi:hypothetical protein